MNVLLVFCTCPDRDSARQLASMLVENHLAACVTLLPGAESVYRWKGLMERSKEVVLLIKTTTDRLESLKTHILMYHPYELPEILAVEAVAGLDDYLEWVVAETRAPLDGLVN